MTFKVLLLLLPFVSVVLFAATYVVTNFIVYETFGKIKENELDDIKKMAAKLALIPFLIVFTIP